MLDDDNAKEMEAALREEEEQDMPDGMTPEEWRRVREEAQAVFVWGVAGRQRKRALEA